MKAWRVFIVFLALVGLGSALLFAQPDTAKVVKRSGQPPAGKPFLSDLTAAQIENVISILPPAMIQRLAKQKGLTTVQGKDITRLRASKGGQQRALFVDRPVSADDAKIEYNATIAARPNNANIVVAAFESYDMNTEVWASCTATSKDKGETWSAPVKLPPRVATDYVYNPVIRYAPNSRSLYAVYISEDAFTSETYVLFSKSTNNGSKWSKPKVVFSPGDYDDDGSNDYLFRPWIDVHYFSDSSSDPYLYITCSVGLNAGGTQVLFRRAAKNGSSFDRDWWYIYGEGYWLGTRAIGGKGGDVIWVFYYSEEIFDTNYPFYIVSIASPDYGESWPGMFSASVPWGYQLPYYLGPDSYYGIWWEGMLPSIAISPSGVAYVAFAADPEEGSETNEDGVVYIIKSPRPYTNWSYPEGLSYDYRASQGYPTVRMKKTANGTVVSVFCENHAWSYWDNELYDITVHRTGLGGSWVNDRVTDVSSLTSWYINQEYLDAAASALTSSKVIHVIWTDRADKLYIDDPETDVYCDLIELIN
jgi:hypothetical protein